MGRLFLFLTIMSVCFDLCGESESRPTPDVVDFSTAYVGGYTCTAVAENIKVESKVFQALVSGTHGC